MLEFIKAVKNVESLRISRMNVIMQSKIKEYFYLIEFDQIINILISLL